MKIHIKLFNNGDGLLDTRAFTIPEGEDPCTRIQDEMAEAIGAWTLDIGDTIKIEEA